MSRPGRTVLSRIALLLWIAAVVVVTLRAVVDSFDDAAPYGLTALLSAGAVTATVCAAVAAADSYDRSRPTMLRRKWSLTAGWWLWAGLLASGVIALTADVRGWLDPEDAYAAWAAFWALCVVTQPVVVVAFRLGVWVGSRHHPGRVVRLAQARPSPARRGERLPPG